eukprot:201872-Chlamydomonas_euryale.AAC.1
MRTVTLKCAANGAWGTLTPPTGEWRMVHPYPSHPDRLRQDLHNGGLQLQRRWPQIKGSPNSGLPGASGLHDSYARRTAGAGERSAALRHTRPTHVKHVYSAASPVFATHAAE